MENGVQVTSRTSTIFSNLSSTTNPSRSPIFFGVFN